MAEASSTTSFILGRLAPLRAQLVGKRDSRRDMLPNPFPGTAKTAFPRCNAQLPVHHAHDEQFAVRYPQCFPHRSRYHKTPFRPNAHPNPMILYKLWAFPNDLSLLKFQNFHMSHLSSPVTPFYYGGTNQASGTRSTSSATNAPCQIG